MKRNLYRGLFGAFALGFLVSGAMAQDQAESLSGRALALQALKELVFTTMDQELFRLPPAEFARQRSTNAQVVLRRWMQVDAALKPIPADVGLNAPLPPGAEQFPRGIAPNAIKDPAVRAEYERRIEEHKAQVALINEQVPLRDAIRQFRTDGRDFLIKVYALPPNGDKELEGYLKKYLKDVAMRQEILDKVKETRAAAAPAR